jgi:hypothetical protein
VSDTRKYIVEVLGENGWAFWSSHDEQRRAYRVKQRIHQLVGIRYGFVRVRKKGDGTPYMDVADYHEHRSGGEAT